MYVVPVSAEQAGEDVVFGKEVEVSEEEILTEDAVSEVAAFDEEELVFAAVLVTEEIGG